MGQTDEGRDDEGSILPKVIQLSRHVYKHPRACKIHQRHGWESRSCLVKDAHRSTRTDVVNETFEKINEEEKEETGSLISISSQSSGLTHFMHPVCPHSTLSLALSNTHTMGMLRPLPQLFLPQKDAGHLVGRHKASERETNRGRLMDMMTE